jgi:predicted nucleotidyltransferase
MESFSHRFILNREGFLTALSQGGYSSVSELAGALGVHRNSLSNYLNGGQIFPEVLEKALLALRLDPAKVIKLGAPTVDESTRVIAELSDRIAQKDVRCCVVLFGSRARGRHKRFSDFDLGVYVKGGIPFAEFSSMLSYVDEFNEATMHTAQLTNISEADDSFLTEIGPDLQFLAGSHVAWTSLVDTVRGLLHER